MVLSILSSYSLCNIPLVLKSFVALIYIRVVSCTTLAEPRVYLGIPFTCVTWWRLRRWKLGTFGKRVTSKITSTYEKVLKVLTLLLKNVEEMLFGWIFFGAHTTQMVPKHIWVGWCLDSTMGQYICDDVSLDGRFNQRIWHQGEEGQGEV